MTTSVESGPAAPVAGTQAIRRAFDVLTLFRDEAAPLGVVQIAERLGFTLSTAHRIARALVGAGYLSQAEGRERYRLGPQALLLGQAAQRSLGIDAVRPVLAQLAESTGESVNLGLLDGDEVVVVYRVESAQPLRFSMEVGSRIELYASSMGKALLAFNDTLADYPERRADSMRPLTPTTLHTPASLRAELDAIRARGWSTDDQESLPAVRCVGAPVLDLAGQARAAVAVQAPAVRMPDVRFDELGPVVRRAADQISRLLPV
jgi:IclR family transcriptional regulator, acetate operon repressor